jgi:hypothetical protein
VASPPPWHEIARDQWRRRHRLHALIAAGATAALFLLWGNDRWWAFPDVLLIAIALRVGFGIADRVRTRTSAHASRLVTAFRWLDAAEIADSGARFRARAGTLAVGDGGRCLWRAHHGDEQIRLTLSPTDSVVVGLPLVGVAGLSHQLEAGRIIELDVLSKASLLSVEGSRTVGGEPAVVPSQPRRGWCNGLAALWALAVVLQLGVLDTGADLTPKLLNTVASFGVAPFFLLLPFVAYGMARRRFSLVVTAPAAAAGALVVSICDRIAGTRTANAELALWTCVLLASMVTASRLELV